MSALQAHVRLVRVVNRHPTTDGWRPGTDIRAFAHKRVFTIDFLAFIYDVDDVDDLDWDEEEKLVDLNWPVRSGFKAKAEADGLRIAWSHPDQVTSQDLAGYRPVYEFDRFMQIRRKLVLSDGSVLVGKRQP